MNDVNYSVDDLRVRRQLLQRQLHEQRAAIMQLMREVPAQQSLYPRSKIMRMLIRQPTIAAGVVAAVAMIFGRAHFVRTALSALTATRLLSAVLNRNMSNVT